MLEEYEGEGKTEEDLKSDIRMIRISATPETESFPADTDVKFHIPYSFELAEESLVGGSLEFGPCGVTAYTVNGQQPSGHTPTQRVRVEMRTGRIAGRIFVDENFSGDYDEGDRLIAFEKQNYEEQVPRAFWDDNGNGEQDRTEELIYDLTLAATDQDTGLNGTGTANAEYPVYDDGTGPNAFANTYAISPLRGSPAEGEEREDATYTLKLAHPFETATQSGPITGEKDYETLLRLALLEPDGRKTKDGSEGAPAGVFNEAVQANPDTKSVTGELEVSAVRVSGDEGIADCPQQGP